MLRITREEKGGLTTFHLEGKLIGAWVGELERCWALWNDARDPQKRSRIDLSEVLFVDDRGKTLLQRLAREGAELQANNPFMRSVIDHVLRLSTAAHDKCLGSAIAFRPNHRRR